MDDEKDTDPQTPSSLGVATTDPLFPPKVDPNAPPEVNVTAVQSHKPADASIETLLTGLDDEHERAKRNAPTKPAPAMEIVKEERLASSESAGRDNARFALSARPLAPSHHEEANGPAVVVAPDGDIDAVPRSVGGGRMDRTTVVLPRRADHRWKAFLFALLLVGSVGVALVLHFGPSGAPPRSGTVEAVLPPPPAAPSPSANEPVVIDPPSTAFSSLPVASASAPPAIASAVAEPSSAPPATPRTKSVASAAAPASSASSVVPRPPSDPSRPPPDPEFGRKF